MSSSLYSLWKKYPDLFSFRGKYKSVNEESLILVGTPLHRNLGYHLLAESEQYFLKDTFPGQEIYEIPTEVFMRNFIFLKMHTPAEARVFITGGAWMGDLWTKYELVMQRMFDSFSHCRLTVLPQTIYYDDQNGIFLDNTKRAMAKCKDLKFCAREEASFKMAPEYLGVENITLAPDMGLYFKTDIDNRNVENGAAGICLRNDRDKIKSDNVDTLKQQLEFEFSTKEIDTIAPKDVGYYERREKIDEALRVFASCPVVMTDRLQGMIFSVLVGTKCIALKTKTDKIAGIYDKWLNWDKNIVLADTDLDSTDMETFICSPYRRTGYTERLKPEFDKLKDFIR